jgi:hypothetical protein
MNRLVKIELVYLAKDSCFYTETVPVSSVLPMEGVKAFLELKLFKKEGYEARRRKRGQKIDWDKVANDMGYKDGPEMIYDQHVNEGRGPAAISTEIEAWLGANWAPTWNAVLNYMVGLGYKMNKPGRQYTGDRIAKKHGFEDCKAMLVYFREERHFTWNQIADELEIRTNMIHKWRERIGYK